MAFNGIPYQFGTDGLMAHKEKQRHMKVDNLDELDRNYGFFEHLIIRGGDDLLYFPTTYS